MQANPGGASGVKGAVATCVLTVEQDVRPVPAGSSITMDYRLDRVRVFHDSQGNVVRPPKPG